MLPLWKIYDMAKKIFIKQEYSDLRVVNTDTGEIVSGVADVRCETIDDFIMLFLASIPYVTKLEGNAIRVLMWCWKYSSFNKTVADANIITNDKAFKESIRRDGCELSDSVINKAIYQLAKENMLIKRCKGSYMLNPQYFFKGTLSDRSKLRCNITYNPETKSDI